MAFSYAKLNPDFAVAPQLEPTDMVDVKQAGFKSVIINRPDHEGGSEQPLSQDVMRVAQEQGLQIVYQPVVAGQITVDNVEQFADYLSQLPKPILAFCRTGRRCTALYEAAVQFSQEN